MAAIELIFSAIMFVITSGLLYAGKHNRNPWLVGAAAFFAIISFFSLIAGFLPLPDISSTEATQHKKEQSPLKLKHQIDSPISRPGSAPLVECNFEQSETLDQCINRYSNEFKDRNAAIGTAYLSQAYMEQRNGDLTAAMHDYAVVIDSKSFLSSNEAHLQRGIYYTNNGYFKEGLKDCEASSNFERKDVNQVGQALSNIAVIPYMLARTGPIYTCMGTALSKLGRHDEAVKALNNAIDAGVGTGITYYYRAQSREKLGDALGAEADFRLAQQSGVHD